MRWMIVVLVFVTGMASAKDCEPPFVNGKEITGLVKFSNCMNEKVAVLERENDELRKDLEKLQLTLKKLPGELVNDNGRKTRTGGEAIAQATFITSARRREAPSALPIDKEALEALCAVSCRISLVLAGEGLRKDDPATVSAVAACDLRYDAKTGDWSQGGGCGDAVSGVDGDGKPPGKSGGEVIATAGSACVLADSEPSRSLDMASQLLDADRAKGLFLIAAPALWSGDEARFRCELKITR